MAGADGQPVPVQPAVQPATAAPAAQAVTPAPVGRDAKLPLGSTLFDGQGNPWRVQNRRNGILTLQPIVNGTPDTKAARTFVIDPEKAPANTQASRDPLYLQSPNTSAAAAAQKEADAPQREPMDVVNTRARASDAELGLVLAAGPVFSRALSGAPPGTQKAVQSVVDTIRARWANAPEIVVLTDMQDPAVPEAVRTEDSRQRSMGATGDPEGFWHGGKAYLVASALPTSSDVVRALFHESLGHYGLRGAFGSALDGILDQLWVAQRARVTAKAAAYGYDTAKVDQRRLAAEEVLAELAQTSPTLGFVRRTVAAIRTWLRETFPGMRLQLSDDEIIRSFILPARAFVETGRRAAGAGPVAARGRAVASLNDREVEALVQQYAAVDGAPTPAAIREAVRQFRDVERAYGGRDGYRQARDAGRTRLNYGQWVQVRTPNFKAWFGNWEGMRAQARLDAMTPLAVAIPADWRGLNAAELRNRMRDALDALVKNQATIEHPELGEIKVGRVGARKTISASKDPAKPFVASDLKALLPASIYARSEPSRGGDGPDVDGYSTLLARVSVDGTPLVAVFTVRHQTDGRWYYNSVTLHDGKGRAQDSYGRPDLRDGGSRFAPIAGLDTFVRRSLSRVNPDQVSKAIDAQTGEPMVMYHGTKADFVEFRATSGELGKGVYFSPSADTAAMFASRAAGEAPSVMPVYVRTQNPLVTGDRNVPRAAGPSKLKRQGYDGVIFTSPTGDVQHLVFDPAQVKSATGNVGTFDPATGDIRFARGINSTRLRTPLGFYSALADGVQGIPTNSAPAAGWRDAIKGLVNKGLVKQEEIEWTGLNEWLDLQKGRVSKEQVAEYLRAGGVQVEETVLGGNAAKAKANRLEAEIRAAGYDPSFSQTDSTVYRLDREDGVRFDWTGDEWVADEDGQTLPENIEALADALSTAAAEEQNAYAGEKKTKYGQYTLPGGENYREVLLTLPSGKLGSQEFRQSGGAEVWIDGRLDGRSDIDLAERRAAMFRANPANANRTIEVRPVNAEVSRVDREYRSSHWDQPNVLAHIRVNDRTDADGARVLFVEEIQSDWGQDGKKRGFDSANTRYTVAQDQRPHLPGLDGTMPWAVLRDGTPVDSYATREEAEAAAQRRRAGEERAANTGIPAAPFVTKTDNWLALALKRVLTMAAEGGYDKVAFTTGEQNAERYDLSKQISRVEFVDNVSGGAALASMEGPVGRGVLRAYGTDGKRVLNERIDGPEGIETYVGKEVAQRLVETRPTQSTEAGMGARLRSLSGLDLKVGGEGMKAFYDKIVPNAVRALAKKLGGRMETVEFPKALGVRDGSREFLPDQEAGSQPGLVITPEMRAKIDEGLPMFSRSTLGPRVPAQAPAGPQTRLQRLKARVMDLTSPEALDRLIYNLQNKFIDLKRIQDHITAIGGTLTDLNDAYLGEELFHKRLATRTEAFLKDEVKPLMRQLRATSTTIEELEQFLHARHAPEANRVLAERNPNQAMIDAKRTQLDADVRQLELDLQRATAAGTATKAIEQALEQARAARKEWVGVQAFQGTEEERLSLSGMSDQDAAAYQAALPAGKRQVLDALAARVDALQAKTLTTLERYGLMDRASLDAWRTTYQHYVPLHRDEAHPDSVSHPIGQGYSTKGDASRRRTGSNQKVTNILGHIVMQREAALTRGEKAVVGKKLYLLAAQNPDPNLWSVDKPPKIKRIDPRTGTVVSVVDPMFKNLPNVVMVRIAGKDAAITFNERNPQAVRLAEAFKNLDVGDVGMLLGWAAKGTRWFASINTQYNPIFGLINFGRDVQAGLLNLSTTPLAGKQGKIAADAIPAMRAIYRDVRGKTPLNAEWARLWKQMQEDGGTTGYRDLFVDAADRANALQKELESLDRGQASQAAHAVVNWLSDYNETMENAIRLAAYKEALDVGMTRPRAASLAKNLTVNFNRKGRFGMQAGALYAFFNASLQGTARLAETLAGPAGRKIMLGGIMVGVVNTLLGMAAMGGGDDDEWAKITDFIKERSIIIPIGRQDYVTLPMPLGFHVLPNIGRIAVEMMAGNNEKSAGRQVGSLLATLVDAFNPMGSSQDLAQLMAPTVIDPVVALMQNKDWTGKPIYRPDWNQLDPTPGHQRAKDSASTPARVLSQFLNFATGGTEYRPGAISWTPDQIDYVIGQLTGGLGRELLKVNQTITAPFTGDELPAYKIPLVGRLYGNTRGPANQSERFYENVREINEIENEVKGRARAGQDFQAVLREEPLAALIGAGAGAEKQISELRKVRREAVRQSQPGYQAQVQQINEQIGGVMAALNKQVRTAREASAVQ